MIGTSVASTFCTFCRIEIMATDRPKIISSGGSPPALGANPPFAFSETAILIPSCLRWEHPPFPHCTHRTKLVLLVLRRRRTWDHLGFHCMCLNIRILLKEVNAALIV